MSTLYPDLPLTQYPSNLDSFTTWLNITATDGPLIQQYIAAMNAGNQTLANQILTQISSASQKIITATDLNTMTQAIQAVERFYLTDIQPYIQNQQESWLNTINQFSYQGTWQTGTNYVTNNIVSYTVSGVNLLFIATSNPPTGTAPTNTTYWRVLTIQGQQGTSGTGLSYRQEWNNSTLYGVNDTVTYSQALWMATAQNQNQQPTEGSSYWKLVMTLTATQYPIQDTEPQNLAAGDLWFNTQDNPTKYYYLAELDNPITQEMIPVGYQTYGEEGVVLNGAGPLPVASGGTGATTAQAALAALGAGVRNNELDNAYFVGGGTGWGVFPVNQRGVSGTISTPGYFIDRWKLVSGTVQITAAGLVLNGTIAQILPGSIGNVYTATALTTEGIETCQYDDASRTFTVTGTGQTFVFAKLEKGLGQTAAYQNTAGSWIQLPQPGIDYATQLARCQRYFQKIDTKQIGVGMTETDAIWFSWGFPVEMRTTPVATIKNLPTFPYGKISDVTAMGTKWVSATTKGMSCSFLVPSGSYDFQVPVPANNTVIIFELSADL